MSPQLHFKVLAPEAQRAAIQRLALCGRSIDEIAADTGWEVWEVRRVIQDIAPVVAWANQRIKGQPPPLQEPPERGRVRTHMGARTLTRS